MPLVYDSVLAGALARSLDRRWRGRRLESVRFDGEARRVTLGLGDETWAWLLHPTEGGVLLRLPDAATRRRDRGILDGRRDVVRVVSPRDTRSVLLELDEGVLAFDLVTNRWNALHVVDARVRSLLVAGIGRDPIAPGDPWAAPVSERRWADVAPDAAGWATMVAETAAEGRGRRGVAWISGTNEAFVFGEDGGDERDPAESLRRWMALREAATADGDGARGWLLPDPRRPERTIPYPSPLDAGEDAEEHEDVVGAIAAWAAGSEAIREGLRAAGEPAEVTAVRDALRERRERAEKKIRSLEAEVGESADPEELRELGHLLLARKSAVRPGASSVEVEDFAGGTRTIELDPTLDAVGNAEAFYDRAKRVERAAAKLPARIAKARRRLEAIDRALAGLDAVPPGSAPAIDDATWKLAGGRRGVPGSVDDRGRGRRRDADAERLPYRVYRTSTGREIRAGRSAKANDDLTFRHSAPDDIWMHVRESPGSHVVLRWGDRDQNPPEAEIAEAALVAAVLSRARGASVVPVAWTRRKYVRKPRKAPPGAVVPERTQTVFVAPDARRVARMAEEE